MRNEFNLPEDFIYLNSGTMSFSPRVVLETVRAHKNIFEMNPAHGYVAAWPQLWAVQKSLATFLKARPQDLFLRANVTYAMNDFIMALKLPAGSEILVSSLEYGAIANICRYKAETEGHTIKVMQTPVRGEKLKRLTTSTLLEDFEKHLTPKTRFAVFSHVTTGSGFVFPVEEMARICRRRQVIFAVDGAHGIGSVPLDFSRTQMDFYGTNLHKWMMGPKGTGLGWVSPQVRAHLQPKFAGWTTYDQHPIFSVFGDGDPWTYRWMLCSTHNFADFLGISSVLDFWNSKGPEKIFALQRKLRNLTAAIIPQKTGWTCLDPAEESFRGPMVAFDLPDILAQRGLELMASLREKNSLQISVTQLDNRWCLRLAPHIYNAETEIEKAAEILSL